MEAHNIQTMYSNYFIYSSTSSSELTGLVNTAFSEGYVPIGGLAVEPMNGYTRYHQAVAKPISNGTTGQKTTGR
jgi:hypothetical protein